MPFQDRLFYLNTAYSDSTFQDFARFHFRIRQPFLILGGQVLSILVFLWAGLRMLFAYISGTPLEAAFPVTLTSVVSAAALLLLSRSLYLPSAKSMYRYACDRGDLSLSISFYPDHFETKTARGGKSISYDQLLEVYETGGYFYLYREKNTATIVPKNSFVSGDVDAICDFLMKKVPSYHVKINKSKTGKK